MEDSNSHKKMSSLLWSRQDWNNWFLDKLEAKKLNYSRSPDEMIAAYNREKNHIKEYHGRQLIELIQNADDAGFGYESESRLLIELTNDALFIANTGNPFSDEGFTSLMISDISPKQAQGLKFIGYKGLGFRSVLGWANSIIIVSGQAEVIFSDSLAIKWLEKLSSNSSSIRERIDDFYQKTNIQFPIATLDIPHPLSQSQSDQDCNNLIDYTSQIRNKGYDTIIAILLKNPDEVIPQIKKQLNEVVDETFIFMQNIRSTSINFNGDIKHWAIERDSAVVEIAYNDKPSQIWEIFSDSDVIPKNIISDDYKFNNKYELKLAVHAEGKKTTDKLFSYFPTNVTFPFNIVAHGTFELSANRKNLINSKVNEYIFERLAELMALRAEDIVRGKPNDPWFVVESLVPVSTLHPDIEEFGFREKLISELKTKNIIPTYKLKFKSTNEVKRLNCDLNNLVDAEILSDICLFYKEENTLELLDIDFLEYDELVKRINTKHDQYSHKERAILLKTLCKSYDNEFGDPPNLLIDEQHCKIENTRTAILPPEGKTFNLPEWVPLRVISKELVSILKDQFNVKRNRDLAQKLTLYSNVQEYNVRTILLSIISEANSIIKNDKENELDVRIKAVQAVWEIYKSLDQSISFPDTIRIVLPTSGKSFKPSKELYFSKEYPSGKLLQALFGGNIKELFVAPPHVLLPDAAIEGTELFLKWLGVASDPRIIKSNVEDADFKGYVLSKMDSDTKFEEFTLSEALKRGTNSLRIENVSTVENLDLIIKKADPHAIVAWCAIDRRLEDMRLNGDDIKIRYDPGGRFNYRYHHGYSLPSYVLWKLSNEQWLPIIDGSKKKPVSCSLTKATKDLTPILGFPAIDIKHNLFKALRLDSMAIKSSLMRLGVIQDLDELPWSTLYEILLKLPEVDPNGDHARQIYRLMIGRNEIDNPPPSGKNYEKFLEMGLMLGRKNGISKYYPCNKLFYLENNIIPSHIADLFSTVDIDRRRGARKVKALFNIETLTPSNIHMSVSKYSIHPLSERFEKEINNLKPYIYAMRIDSDSRRVELGQLRKLKITLCKSLSGEILVENNIVPINLEYGRTIQDKDVAYLVIDEKISDSKLNSDVVVSDAVGELITSRFRADISSDISRIMSTDPGQRKTLLGLIIGKDAVVKYEEAQKLLEIIEDDNEDLLELLELQSDQEKYQDTATETKITQYVDDPKTDKVEDLNSIQDDEIGDIDISRGSHEPITPKRVKIRLRKNPKTQKVGSSGTMVNPNRAENLAIQAELELGRIPIKVSFIQGEMAFGCDIISFISEDDKERFLKDSNISHIHRFIEVKGRSSSSGVIVLGGNELNAAKIHHDRYYLYRVQERKHREFELLILNNPIEDPTTDDLKKINIFQSAKTEKWDIQEL
ncbi:MAG: DUF3883 domain-containing protein [Candidatus Electryonea clarkiae]|nr:DUF3883 domain-containing protein [Candidatus Electryonea clarkiae]MDP8285533.1 DUF3883 domain-containing protein [Candidatus Electryonea clarkiae]